VGSIPAASNDGISSVPDPKPQRISNQENDWIKVSVASSQNDQPIRGASVKITRIEGQAEMFPSTAKKAQTGQNGIATLELQGGGGFGPQESGGLRKPKGERWRATAWKAGFTLGSIEIDRAAEGGAPHKISLAPSRPFRIAVTGLPSLTSTAMAPTSFQLSYQASVPRDAIGWADGPGYRRVMNVVASGIFEFGAITSPLGGLVQLLAVPAGEEARVIAEVRLRQGVRLYHIALPEGWTPRSIANVFVQITSSVPIKGKVLAGLSPIGRVGLLAQDTETVTLANETRVLGIGLDAESGDYELTVTLHELGFTCVKKVLGLSGERTVEVEVAGHLQRLLYTGFGRKEKFTSTVIYDQDGGLVSTGTRGLEGRRLFVPHVAESFMIVNSALKNGEGRRVILSTGRMPIARLVTEIRMDTLLKAQRVWLRVNGGGGKKSFAFRVQRRESPAGPFTFGLLVSNSPRGTRGTFVSGRFDVFLGEKKIVGSEYSCAGQSSDEGEEMT
jgi:hypothetical protein